MGRFDLMRVSMRSRSRASGRTMEAGARLPGATFAGIYKGN